MPHSTLLLISFGAAGDHPPSQEQDQVCSLGVLLEGVILAEGV